MRFKVLIFITATLLIISNSFAQAPVLTANTGHTRAIRAIDFSHDGKYLVTASDDWSLKIWDIESGKLLRTIKDTYPAYISFSTDGKYIFGGSDNKKTMKWETMSGRLVDSLETHTFKPENISPNNAYKSTDKEGEITLYNNRTDEVIRTFKGEARYIGAHGYSEDSKLLAFGDSDGLLRLWTLPSGKELKSIQLPDAFIEAITFSYDKKTLAVSMDATVYFIDIASGKQIKEFKRQGAWELYEVKLNNSGSDLQIVGTEPDVSIHYDLVNGRKPRVYSNARIGNLNDHNFMVYRGKQVELWDIKTRKFIKKLNRHGVSSPNGKLCASLGANNEIIIFDLLSGKDLITLKGHASEVEDYRFSNDGQYLVSADDDVVILWSVKTGTPLKKIKASYANPVGLSDNNKYIIIMESSMTQYEHNTLMVHSTISGEQLNVFYSLSYFIDNTISKDEKYYLKTNYKELIISRISDNSVVKSITDFDAPLYGASFLANDKFIVTQTEDETLKFWETTTGKLVATQKLRKNRETATFDYLTYTPDGRFDGTEEGMKLLHFTQGMNILPVSSFFEQFYTPNLLGRILSGEQPEPIEIKLSNLKAPPLVKISSPKNNAKSSTGEITVTVTATDQGGGIDEIRTYHNGKLVDGTQRGLQPTARVDAKKSSTFTIQLTNGENIIRATAFSKQRTESVPDEVKVYYKGLRTTADLYMLVIGIDKYKNPKYNLNYAIADASAFKKQVEAGSQTIFGKTEAVFLTDNQATKQEIANAFNTLKTKAKANDVFIFYYAGHGVMSEDQKSEFYIVPHDVTQLYGNNGLLKEKGISAKELQDFSRELEARKQLFIFDACQSGGMVEHLASRGAAEEKAIAQLARSTGTYWLAASNSEQFATEFATLGHGLFTYTILQALKGDADGSNKDKKITVKEISAYLNDKVPELSEKYKGSAQYPNSYGYGQDFPVVIVK